MSEPDQTRDQYRGPRPAGSRIVLLASLPAAIMLLAGFTVVFLIGVDRIGFWKTLLLWAVIFGIFALGLVLMVRRRGRGMAQRGPLRAAIAALLAAAAPRPGSPPR